MTSDIWNFPGQDDWSTVNLVGYKVHATDGDIGTVDDASAEVGAGYIVVDTGPWIFGKKVMLPAGIIKDVDRADEKIFVGSTKDEIKDSPEFDESNYQSADYRENLGVYYGRGL